MKKTPAPSKVHGVFKEHYSGGYFNPAPALAGSVLPYLTRKQQHAVILKALRIAPRVTDYFRSVGVYMPNSRIWEIRQQGYDIQTRMVSVVGIDSRMRPMALYTLNEPTAEQLAAEPVSPDPVPCAEYVAWAGDKEGQ